MEVFKQKEKIIEKIQSIKKTNQIIGFVPTMGALHQGHATLIKKAIDECDISIISIFVNPTQFNNSEDLINYPKPEKVDLELLKDLGVDIAFLPTVEEMYPKGESSDNYEFNGLENVMEGEHRPGHFAGVSTIVNRFFEIIKPNKAFFGEKDFQQLLIVKELAKQKHSNLEIVGVPIVREKDGLAMSSRNQRLTDEYRNAAPIIYQSLQKVKLLFNSESVENIHQEIHQIFNDSILELEYFDIVDESNLNSVKSKDSNTKYRAFIAAFAGEIRLIDNISL